MDERLVGSWRLLSLRMELEDTGEITEPWGTQPQGWLVLTPEGRLITVTTAGHRLLPTTDAEAAAQLLSMVCYSGKTRMDGNGRFVTEVDVAWHPAWLGTKQARNFTLEGEILSIHTDVVVHPAYPGRSVSFMLSWRREM
jgi:Lipocalin-like domain